MKTHERQKSSWNVHNKALCSFLLQCEHTVRSAITNSVFSSLKQLEESKAMIDGDAHLQPSRNSQNSKRETLMCFTAKQQPVHFTFVVPSHASCCVFVFFNLYFTSLLQESAPITPAQYSQSLTCSHGAASLGFKVKSLIRGGPSAALSLLHPHLSSQQLQSSVIWLKQTVHTGYIQ